MPAKNLDSYVAKIGEFYPDRVHNEPVIYRAILFAQKAQVSVERRAERALRVIRVPTVGTSTCSNVYR